MRGPAEQQWAAPPGGADPGGPPSRPHAAHSLPIGRVLGFPLEVHWTFLALIPLVVVLGLPGGAGGVIAGVVWIVALFASVVVHELAHCLVARRRGGDVLGILLLPIGGLSRMARIPTDPHDEAAVAVAGPATSVGLGVVLLAIGVFALGGSLWPVALVSGNWLVRLGWMNLILAAFNLVPALPMDGGRVLRAGLAGHMPRQRATRIAATLAKLIAAALIVGGAFTGSFWFVVIGVFVYLGASGEEAQARVDRSDDDDLHGHEPPVPGHPPWSAQGPPDPRWGWDPRWGPSPQWPPPVPQDSDPSQWPPPPPQWPAPQWPPPPPPQWPAPQWPPPPPPPQWPAPQWPPPPSPPPATTGEDEDSAIHVPVERRRADPRGSEPSGQRIGQHH